MDAFIYDGTVLDYLVAQDEDCRLLTVGSWYAMTGKWFLLSFFFSSKATELMNTHTSHTHMFTSFAGYGLAFSRNSKYVKMFSRQLLELRSNGDLERLRRYWMSGTCRPGKQEHKSSDPLALEQFLSAFLLLMAGILLAALLLLLEHLYFKYFRKSLVKSNRGGCCALISRSMGTTHR